MTAYLCRFKMIGRLRARHNLLSYILTAYDHRVIASMERRLNLFHSYYEDLFSVDFGFDSQWRTKV